MSLTDQEKEELVVLLKEKERRKRENKLYSLFPADGEFRRELYPKHLEFFKAGKDHAERAFIAANRVGKTVAGAYEVACHLLGEYPDWWEGRRFKEPVSVWAAGKTNETTRDILQKELVGTKYDLGTGLVPKDAIVGNPTSRPGVPNAVQDIRVRHVTGGISDLSFKAYQQGVDSFMGTAKHVIWLDEEPDDYNIYTECLTRTMTTRGMILCTFTPLSGLSDTVMQFLPGGKFPENGVVKPHE